MTAPEKMTSEEHEGAMTTPLEIMVPLMAGAMYFGPTSLCVSDQKGEPFQKSDEDKYDYVDRVADWKIERDKCAGKSDINVAKQRNGPTGVVKVYFDEKTMRFGDLQQGEFYDV